MFCFDCAQIVGPVFVRHTSLQVTLGPRSGHSVATQWPHSGHCKFVGFWLTVKKHLNSLKLLNARIPRIYSGHCVATEWPLSGHCVATVGCVAGAKSVHVWLSYFCSVLVNTLCQMFRRESQTKTKQHTRKGNQQ